MKTIFTDNGEQIVRHEGMRGTWKITGFREVTISQDDGRTRVFHFNYKMNAYQEVGGSTTGEIWK